MYFVLFVLQKSMFVNMDLELLQKFDKAKKTHTKQNSLYSYRQVLPCFLAL